MDITPELMLMYIYTAELTLLARKQLDKMDVTIRKKTANSTIAKRLSSISTCNKMKFTPRLRHKKGILQVVLNEIVNKIGYYQAEKKKKKNHKRVRVKVAKVKGLLKSTLSTSRDEHATKCKCWGERKG